MTGAKSSGGSKMRLIPGFVIVVFFSAALILSYITWTTLMKRRESLRFESENAANGGESLDRIHGGGENSNVPKSIYNNLSPQLKSIQGVLPKLSSVDEESLFGADALRNAERLRMKIISNLRRHVIDGSSVKGHLNHYNVSFSHLKRKPHQNARDMMCRIKKLRMSILNEKSSPTFQGKSFPNEDLLSDLTLFGGSQMESPGANAKSRENSEPLYKTCAVIPNSAALDGSQHGIDIDSHDFILRFNNAPTKGYEEDVGALTSLRILNSQVVTKPKFGFPHSSFFKENLEQSQEALLSPATQQSEFGNAAGTKDDQQQIDSEIGEEVDKDKEAAADLDSLWSSTKKFLLWDPCNYSSNLEQWIEKPEHPIFEKYFNITSRTKEFGKNRFYTLDCRVIWKLWDLLFEYTFAKIYGTPPTSGFIGIALAMQNCERVNVYEYIPSIRESVRCHYYSPKNESNIYCTYGSWHPVSAEKLFFLGITDSPDKQIFYDGVMSIPGVSTVKC